MLFLYLDESGNYTFSKKGFEYLIYTSLATLNPYMIHHRLCELEKVLKRKKILLESGYFHASEDKQVVRDEVYKVLGKTKDYQIDAVIVEKSKTNPSLRDPCVLYKKIYAVLLKYVFTRYSNVSKILIFLDVAPVKKKKDAIEKGLKESLSEILDKKNIGREVKYYILHLSSVFSYGLQAVDYCCWALKKKWGDWGKKIDLRPYNEIKHNLISEFDIFKTGDSAKYY